MRRHIHSGRSMVGEGGYCTAGVQQGIRSCRTVFDITALRCKRVWLMQGYFCHWKQLGWCSHPRAAHHIQEPDQVRSYSSTTCAWGYCAAAARAISRMFLAEHSRVQLVEEASAGVFALKSMAACTAVVLGGHTKQVLNTAQHAGCSSCAQHSSLRHARPGSSCNRCQRFGITLVTGHAVGDLATCGALSLLSCKTSMRCRELLLPLRVSCSIIFCEAVAIYGVIVAIILQTKLENITREQGLFTKGNMAAGYAIFGAGLTCGFSNLVCG